MTGRQYRRAKRWDRKVYPAYHSGLMDGFDAYEQGRECPDPLRSDYNLNVYLRPVLRHSQAVTNATIARSRGRYDGWKLAAKEFHKTVTEDWIVLQVQTGLARFEALLGGVA